MEEQSYPVRNLAAITMGVNGSKQKIDQVWPLKGKKGKAFKQPDREWWDQLKKTHNIK